MPKFKNMITTSFVRGTIKVLSRLKLERLFTGTESVIESDSIIFNQDYFIIIGVFGDIKGFILVSMDNKFINKLIDIMGTSTMPIPDIQKKKITMTEFSNMLVAHSFTVLYEDYNLDVSLTSPEFYLIDELELPEKVESIIIPINYEDSKTNIYISLSERS